jgi:hypothetical protein
MQEGLVRSVIAMKARHVLQSAGALLGPAGIEIVVMKGAYLAWAVAESRASFRTFADADAVVTRGTLERAAEILCAAPGWTLIGNDRSSKNIRHEGAGMSLDLQRAPLQPVFGGLTTAQFAARSRPAGPFGPHVRLPDPLDAAAIAIANQVMDCLIPGHTARLGLDLALLRARAGVEPAALAARLGEVRMRKMGIVALTNLKLKDPTSTDWIDALEPTVFERAYARVMVPLMNDVVLRDLRASLILSRAVADGPIRAGMSVGWGLGRWARDTLRSLRDGLRA